jgi:DNA-binding MarR family transcriptional regulator
MASVPEFSAEMLAVLAALYGKPTRWQDRSALAVQAGVTPERLHAILRKLAAAGLAEIAQSGTTQPGLVAGARYRLTAEGLASAVITLATAAQRSG